MLIKSDLLFRYKPEEKKQLKFESTAQARFLSINLGGFLFRRFVGDFFFSLPSNLFMLLTKLYGLVLKLWQRDTNWRLLARRPMAIMVSFVFRTMRLKNCLKISRVRIISFRRFFCPGYLQWKLWAIVLLLRLVPFICWHISRLEVLALLASLSSFKNLIF